MKTILITGVSRGIGKGLYNELESRPGLSVYGTTRQGIKGLPGLELSSEESVTNFLQSDSLPAKIDTLVLNAAVYHAGSRKERENLFRINVYANLQLLKGIHQTRGLLKRIPDGGAVIFISSGMGSLSSMTSEDRSVLTNPELTEEDVFEWVQEKLQTGEGNAYSQSKAAVNALVRILSKSEGASIRFVSVCPGWVRTDMGGNGAPRSVERAVGPIADMIEKDQFAGGRFYRDCKEISW